MTKEAVRRVEQLADMPETEAIVPISRNSGITAKPASVAVRIGDCASR